MASYLVSSDTPKSNYNKNGSTKVSKSSAYKTMSEFKKATIPKSIMLSNKPNKPF